MEVGFPPVGQPCNASIFQLDRRQDEVRKVWFNCAASINVPDYPAVLRHEIFGPARPVTAIDHMIFPEDVPVRKFRAVINGIVIALQEQGPPPVW